MHKTSFAGLTELEPGESIFADGSSFTSRNPSVIDHYLQIGARTHQHNGAPALLDPQAPPDLLLEDIGGALPSNTTLLIGYTLLDEAGGETLVSPTALVTTSGGIGSPLASPTTELLYDAGTLTVGTYHYAVTLVDVAGGETPPSPLTDVVRDPGYPNAHIRILGLSDYVNDTPGAIRYRLYRAKNSDTLNLIAEGVQDTIDDDGTLDCDCCAHPPESNVNTTGQTSRVTVTVPADAVEDATAWRLYITDTGELTSPALFGPTRALAEAGQPIVVDQVLVADGAPPDVATTVDGAAKIDPDTDLLDWHWKRPVATSDDLVIDSDTTEGDTRLVLADGSLWSFRGGSWAVFTAPAAYWMPPVADVPTLPMVGDAIGDTRLVLADLSLWAWDGDEWILVAGGNTTPVTGGHAIADEDTAPLPTRGTLAFKGDGVVVTDDLALNRTIVTIPGATGGGGGADLQLEMDEAVEWADADGATRLRLYGRRATSDQQWFSDGFDGPPLVGWSNALGNVGDDGNGFMAPLASHPLVSDKSYWKGGSAERDIEVTIEGFQFTTTNWNTFGVAIIAGASGEKGFHLKLIQEGAGDYKVELKYRVDEADVWTVLRTYDVDATAVVIGESCSARIRREGSKLDVGMWNYTSGLDLIPGESGIDIPAAMANFQGVPAVVSNITDHDSWKLDGISAFFINSSYQLIAAADGNETTVANTVNEHAWMFAPGDASTGWTPEFQVRNALGGGLQFKGKITKTSDAAPAPGELMFTFDYEKVYLPVNTTVTVVTGDSDGKEVGMAELSSADNTMRWAAGKATDPSTKLPYVLLDGLTIV